MCVEMRPWKITLIFLLVTPQLICNVKTTRNEDDPHTNKQIVIIGAGISGLFSAYLLHQAGFKNVTVLEGRNRVGGRIRTVPYRDSYIEIGAQYLHYPHENDAFSFLQQHGEHIYDLNNTKTTDHNYLQFSLEKCDQPIIEAITTFIDNAYEECGLIWDDWRDKGDLHGIPREGMSLGEFLLRRCEEQCPKYQTRRDEAIKKAIVDATLRITGDNEGEDAFKVSALLLGRPTTEFGDDQYLLPKNGYKEVIDIIMSFIPNEWVKLNEIVNHINYFNAAIYDDKINIDTQNGSSYQADHVISTIPLGVLKEHANSMFFPPLPYRKRRAIELISAGAAMKLIFRLDEKVLWANDWDILETQNSMIPIWLDGLTYEGRNYSQGYNHSSDNIRKYWNRYIAFMSRDINDPHVWTAWLFGESAKFAETLSEKDLMIGLEECFRVALHRIKNIGKPQLVARTRWISDPFTRGTYSNIPQTCDKELIWTGDLATPICRNKVPILMFAGEATSDVSIGTINGAMKSARKEVESLLNLYKSS
ncbi:Peroxisomal N(1)-acetyl-spermine/spermidine oxidase [Nymphon striatum]|nr:Peroxisomal N(1)-acetyl-spermine/spermidine oxidase [Nymphon striatum]